jgi:hypothetical protein
MDEKLFPFMYATLVFTVVTFIFILLGRILLNVETIYFYDFETINTRDNDYLTKMTNKIKEKGELGWKYEELKKIQLQNTDFQIIFLIFVKTKNKIKFF